MRWVWAVVVLALAGGALAEGAQLTLERTRLAALPEESAYPAASADGLHVAWAEPVGAGWAVALDGVRGQAVDAIGPALPAFGPDGRLAYAASVCGAHYAVVAGRAHRRMAPVAEIVLSPDGKGFADVTRTRGEAILRDGVLEPTWNAVQALTYSPDGAHLAYIATDGDMAVVVADGVAQTAYDAVDLTSLTYSQDGQHLAYVVWTGGKCHVVVDGVLGPGYAVVTPPALAPTGGRCAYGAFTGGWWQMVTEDAYSAGYWWGLADRRPVFSPDGAHLAYLARTDLEWCVVADGDEGPTFPTVYARTVGWSSGGRLAYAARGAEGAVVVVDGEAGPPFTGIVRGGPLWSPDGAHLAYAALIGDVKPVALGATRPEVYAAAGESPPVPAASGGGQWVLVGGPRVGSPQVVVVDGVRGPEYDAIGKLAYSADSQHFAYVAQRSTDQYIVLDGVESLPLGLVVSGGPTFRPDGSLECLSVREGALHRLVLRVGAPRP